MTHAPIPRSTAALPAPLVRTCLTCLAVLCMALFSPRAHAQSVPDRLLALINAQIAGTLSASDVDFAAPASVVLRGVLVKAPSGDVVASADVLTARLALGALLSGDLVIREVTGDGVNVNLVRKNGKVNIAEAFTPNTKGKTGGGKAASDFVLRVNAMRVRSGRFRYTDDAVGLRIDARGVAASGSLDVVGSSLAVRVRGISVANGGVELPQLAVPLGSVRASEVVVTSRSVRIEGLTAALLGGHLSGGGALTFSGAGKYRLKANVDLPAGAWPDKLAPLAFATPRIDGTVALSGPLSAPLIDVDAALGRTTAYGYRVQSGKAKLRVTTKGLQFMDTAKRPGTMLRLSQGGTVFIRGGVDFDARALDLGFRLQKVATGAVFGGRVPSARGTGHLSGTAHLSGGWLFDQPVQLDGQLVAQNVTAFHARLPPKTAITVSGNLTKNRVRLSRVQLTSTAPRLEATLSGTVDWNASRLDLPFALDAAHAHRLSLDLPARITVGRGRAEGRISGPLSNVVVAGDVVLTGGDAYGTPVRTLSSKLRVTPERIALSGLSGIVADGHTKGHVVLDSAPHGWTLGGQLTVDGLDAATIAQVKKLPLPPVQFTNGRIALSGPATAPLICVSAAPSAAQPGRTARPDDLAAGAFVMVHRTALNARQAPTSHATLRACAEALGTTVPAGLAALDEAHARQGCRTRVIAADVRVSDALLTARGPGVGYCVDDERLSGTVHVDNLDLAKLSRLPVDSLAKVAPHKLHGAASGTLQLGGTADAPDIRGALDLAGLGIKARPLGGGPATLRIHPDPRGGPGALALSTAGHLSSAAGRVRWRAALALERDQLVARVELNQLDVATWASAIGVDAVAGELHGVLEARGALRAPHVRGHLAIPALWSTGQDAQNHGRVDLAVDWNRGALDARVCGLPKPGVQVFRTAKDAKTSHMPGPLDPWAAERCATRTHGLQALNTRVRGTFTLNGASDLRLYSTITALSPTPFVAALKRAEADVMASGSIRGQLSRRTPAQPWRWNATVELDKGSGAHLPKAKPVKLAQSATIAFSPRGVVLQTPVQLTGDGDFKVSGKALDDQLDLQLEGKVALALLKVFTDDVARAEGTAEVHLELRGSRDKPLPSGTFSPSPGAVVLLRAYGTPLQFVGGTMKFKPEGTDGVRADVTTPLRMRLGSGEAQLDGHVRLAGLLGAGTRLTVAEWALVARGSGLDFRSKKQWAEAAFALRVSGEGDAPHVAGRVELTDGEVQKKFELKNFVLTSSAPSSAPWQSRVPALLKNTTLDIEVAVQSFRAQADVPAFSTSIDTRLRGDARITGPLLDFKLDGAAEIVDGVFNFPEATFDVLSSTLELREGPDGSLQPILALTAETELSQRDFPGLPDETLPVTLLVDGTLDQMKLDLFSEGGSGALSRTELFSMIYLGVAPASSGDVGGTKALQAVSRELTAGFTRQVEDAIAENLGANVDVNLAYDGSWRAGLRWELGRRLELEGGGSLAASGADVAFNPDVRMRLLLMDHVFSTRELALEGGYSMVTSATSTTASPNFEMRLSLRVFEQ